MKRASECTLAEGFSTTEKAWAQVSFLAMGTLGTSGIVVEDWPWIFPYILIFWYGIPGGIMRHLNCPRCPHLHRYGDCVQAPVSLTKRLVKRRKTGPFSRSEKLLFLSIFILIPAYPVFWLVSHIGFLIAFLIAAGAWYAGQFLHFCRRCRVFDCPFNRVPVARRTS